MVVRKFYGTGFFGRTRTGLFPDSGMWQMCARCNDAHGFHRGERSLCPSTHFIGRIYFDDYDVVELTRFDYFYFLHYKLNSVNWEEDSGKFY